MSSFSEYLKALLSEKRVDQKELARRMGMSYAYINQLVNGSKSAPKPAVSAKIAQALACSVKERKELLDFSIERFVGRECSDLVSSNLREKAGSQDLHNSIKAKESSILWALIRRLPEPGSLWPDTERSSWLKAAEAIFGLEYKAG